MRRTDLGFALLSAAILSLMVMPGCGEETVPVGCTVGVSCDDGNPCTVADQCTEDGDCMGSPMPCEGTAEGGCRLEVCDPSTAKCVMVANPDETPCDDSLSCTTGDMCREAKCVGESVLCDSSDDPCADAQCSEPEGLCVDVPRPEGAPCDDGQKCTEDDSCREGLCVGNGIDCSINDGPCAIGICQDALGLCETEVFSDGTTCEDGDPCTIDERCANGNCGGGILAPSGSPCDDGDPCTVDESCDAGLCQGSPLNCPEGGPCMVPNCDPEAGTCDLVMAADGSACDDGQVCTVNESCEEGQCQGGSPICFCAEQPDGTACDDDNPCTLNDLCHGGLCQGDLKDCSGDDGPCVRGDCDPISGSCAPFPAFEGEACEDGSQCTTEDACTEGLCVGTLLDCSFFDGPCTKGICDPSTESCTFENISAGVACDDGNPCSTHDQCADGSCTGAIDICTVCAGLMAGDACDDNDPCTDETLCLDTGDGLLRCLGTLKDCTALDTECTVGVCQIDQGECLEVNRADGWSCSDGNGCTEGDQCEAGICAATPIPMCGATPQDCELDEDNDNPGTATNFALEEGLGTMMGRISNANDRDWFVLSGLAGQRLDATTRSHCGDTLDTIMSVHTATNLLLLGEDDDSGEGSYAKVTDVMLPSDGSYLIGVTAYADSAPGDYLLDVTVRDPEPIPCLQDEDCGCVDRACVPLEDASQGKGCVELLATEDEPNNQTGQATPLSLGQELRGEFQGPGETDWFSLELSAGSPVSVGTRSYCDASADTTVSLLVAETLQTVASNSSSGNQGHGAITTYVPVHQGLYYLKVTDPAFLGGAYVVYAKSAACQSDADCGCADQRCEDSLCVPTNPIPEPADPSASPTLPLEYRIHGEIDQPYDVDTYDVDLPVGQWTISTASYCGNTLDTMLSIKNPSGETVVTDEDSGEDFFAEAMLSVEEGDAGHHIISVSAHGPSIGPYTLIVKPTTP